MGIGIKALHNLVFIKRLVSDEISEGGIVIPDNAKERQLRGKVVAIGPGKVKKDGSRTQMEIKVGDTVFFPDMHGWEASLQDDDYTIIREDEILAVLED